MTNAKNRLQELIQARGWTVTWDDVLTREQLGLSGGWRATLEVVLPSGVRLLGTGDGNSKSEADVAAIAAALDDFDVGEEEAGVFADAQGGDALIKLAAYVVKADLSPEGRSQWLQAHEADAYLARVFDQLWEAGDADVRGFGRRRGEKFKASVVEALIWRRFRQKVLSETARASLEDIIQLLAAAGE